MKAFVSLAAAVLVFAVLYIFAGTTCTVQIHTRWQDAR